jgi:hypothetical protein
MAYQPQDVARRRLLLKRAVFGHSGGAGQWPPTPAGPPRVVTGTVLDASPHVLVLETGAGSEERFVLMDSTSAWRGKRTSPAALRPGQHVVVRRYGQRQVADRIWADIGRVAGTIIERTGHELLVDQGHTRGRGTVVIGPSSKDRILVRFPKLEPGFLIDVIGLCRGGFVDALVPATSQPPYHSSHVPRPALVRGHVPETVSGTASWHEPAGEPDGLPGVAYPALDPASGCGGDTVPCDASVSCARLPYLSIGSMLMIKNDCSGRSCALQVTACGSTASRFCDRCLDCGISPRGRVADLTIASFVELGGELHKGCFNATIRIGG